VKPKYCLSSGSRLVVPDFTAVKVEQASRLSRKLASGAVVGLALRAGRTAVSEKPPYLSINQHQHRRILRRLITLNIWAHYYWDMGMLEIFKLASSLPQLQFHIPYPLKHQG
jgi:hypothetical protein